MEYGVFWREYVTVEIPRSFLRRLFRRPACTISVWKSRRVNVKIKDEKIVDVMVLDILVDNLQVVEHNPVVVCPIGHGWEGKVK